MVTTAEFQSNLAKYFGLLAKENIFVTEDGKTIAKISSPNISAVDAISGVLKDKVAPDIDTRIIKNERLAKYE